MNKNNIPPFLLNIKPNYLSNSHFSPLHWVKLRFKLKFHALNKVTRRASTKRELMNTIQKREMKFFGHLVRLNNIHWTLLKGKIEGKRSRGRPRIQWIYDIKKWTTLHYRKAIRTAQDREKLRSVSPNPRPVDGTWTTRR